MVCVYLISYRKVGLYGDKLDDKVDKKYCLTLSTIKNSYYLCDGNINFLKITIMSENETLRLKCIELALKAMSLSGNTTLSSPVQVLRNADRIYKWVKDPIKKVSE
jgi:hypothetical protein